MGNPFSDKAREIINKRDRWAMLVTAREWIENFYEPSKVKISISHHAASGVHGGNDSMIVVQDHMSRYIPSKETLLQEINAELAELAKGAEG